MFGNFNYNMGNEYFKSGDYKTAIEKYNKAIHSGNLDEAGLYNAYCFEGCCFSNLGNYDEAIIVLNSALQLGINHFWVYYELGRAHYKKSEYGQSLQYLEKAIELNSNDFDSWRFKGLALEGLERYKGAETALKTALKYQSSSDPEMIQAINDEIFIIQLKKSSKKATELQENGKYTDAIKVYDSILESISSNSNTESSDDINQIHADSLLNKGICLKSMKRCDAAMDVLKELLDLVPDGVAAYLNLAECCLDLRKFDEALEYFSKAEKYIDNEDAKKEIYFVKQSAIVLKLIQNKDYKAALSELNSIPETSDTLICFKKTLEGGCHFYLENYDEVLNNLLPYVDAKWTDDVFENNSFRGMANTYVGGVYYKRKNYETALKYLKKCAEMDCNALSETGLFMGECYIALGEYEKAIDALRKAIDAWEETDDYDIPYLESRIQFAKEKLAEVKAKVPPSHIIINGNNNPVNLGGILATDDAVINRSVIGKDSAQEETDVCFCPYCGTKINSDFLFCPKCGKKLKEN